MQYTEVLPVVPKREDGFFNATFICRKVGKPFGNWNRSKKAQRLVDRMRVAGIANPVDAGRSAGIYSTQTHVCKEIALDILKWTGLSPEHLLSKLLAQDDNEPNVRHNRSTTPPQTPSPVPEIKDTKEC